MAAQQAGDGTQQMEVEWWSKFGQISWLNVKWLGLVVKDKGWLEPIL